MMALAQRGTLAGIPVYAVDRFTRRPKDLEALIELADDGRLAIEGPRSELLDLTTSTGRQQARWMALQAASESDNTSERVKTTLARKMREGKPMGAGRPLGGFEKGGLVQRPSEVAIIREVAQRMLAGESSARIATDLNDRGLTTSRGGRFTAANLTRMMARPRNGGHVEHRGRIVGTIPGEPILDAATFEALSAQIASRRRGRRPTGRFLLTGLLTCWNDKCGHHTMNGATTTRTRTRIYRCPPQLGGCGQSINARHVEDMVELLSDPENIAEIKAHERALTDARAMQAAKVDAVEKQLGDLEVKWAAGELVPQAYDRAKPVLDRRLAQERAKLDKIAGGGSLAPVDVRADWSKMTTAEKRVLITRCGVRIVIGPHRPAHRFDPGRVRIRRVTRRVQPRSASARRPR